MSAERFVSDRSMSRRSLISAIERVEPRRLLANLVGTDLRIEGTAGNDRIRVETIGANVVVTQNAVAQSFNKTKVKTINANLRNGNDRIDIIWNVVATTTISGEGGYDTVIGGDYKDVIYTGSGNDFVYSGRGGDFIQTSTGNDFISPGSQNDTVDAGDGQDEVSYGDRSTPIDIRFWHAIYRQQMTFENMSRATVTGSGENDEIINLETATLSRGNDRFDLTGDLDDSYPWNGALLNQIYRINTGEGDDVGGVGTGPSFSGSSGSVHQMVIDGGNGNDGFSAWPGYSTTIIGGAGNDTLEVTWDEGDVPVYLPGAGIDWINLGGKHSTITMQPELENVSIFSDVAGREPLDVVVQGNDLDNTIIVGRSNGVTVSGGLGNDLIRAQGSGLGSVGQSPRFLDGGAGNDTIYGSGLNESILGGSGNDIVDVREALPYLDSQSRLVDGGDGNDTIFGSPLNDVIKGGAGNDSIDGGAGADSIYGGTGTDRAKRDSADAIVDSIEVFV